MTASDRITLPTPDGPMPTYLARPDGFARGAVLVVQEAFGVTPHVEEVADRLAAAGWYALAPAFFHRSGSPVFGHDDLAAARPHMAALNAEGISEDVAAALAHVEEAGFGPERRGVVGFCMGGSIAFYAAVFQPVAAAVTFYGGGVGAGRFGFPPMPGLAPRLRAAWLGLYGDRDRSIPVEEVEALRAAATQAPVPTQVVRYPHVEHGFHSDRPATHDDEAATDAWARTLAWFDEHLPADAPSAA